MSNNKIDLVIGDVRGTVTRKKKGTKVVLQYRDMLAIFTQHNLPKHCGIHGAPKTDDEIDTFLSTGKHPQVEFLDNDTIEIYLDNYVPLYIDLSNIGDGTPMPIVAIEQPELTLPLKVGFLFCSGMVVGVSLYRLMSNVM